MAGPNCCHETTAIECLVVEKEQVIGILTARDIVRMTADSLDLDRVGLRNIMTRNSITMCLSPDAEIF